MSSAPAGPHQRRSRDQPESTTALRRRSGGGFPASCRSRERATAIHSRAHRWRRTPASSFPSRVRSRELVLARSRRRPTIRCRTTPRPSRSLAAETTRRRLSWRPASSPIRPRQARSETRRSSAVRSPTTSAPPSSSSRRLSGSILSASQSSRASARRTSGLRHTRREKRSPATRNRCSTIRTPF